MFGNVGETMADIRQSLVLLRRIRPHYAQFSICSPYPATPLYEMARQRGLVAGDAWLDFAKSPLQAFHSPAWTENFTRTELEQIAASAYRSFYLRPRFIWQELRGIRSPAQLMRTLRAGLGVLAR